MASAASPLPLPALSLGDGIDSPSVPLALKPTVDSYYTTTGLPTPNSLPATIGGSSAAPPRLARDSPPLSRPRSRSGSPSLQQESEDEGSSMAMIGEQRADLLFHLSSDEDTEMQPAAARDEASEVGSDAARLHGLGQSSSASGGTRETAFSSNISIQRPFRSRYHHQHSVDVSPPSFRPDSRLEFPAESSAGASKRSWDEVTPSSGSTPPAVHHSSLLPLPLSPESEREDGDISGAAYTPFPFSTSVHSFESQRASITSRTRYLREQESTLRRRSPQTSRAGSPAPGLLAAGPVEGERTKRRRSGTLREEDIEMHDAAPSTSRQSSTAFGPALGLGRYPPRSIPIDPVLTTSGPSAGDDLSTIRRRSRLSLTRPTQLTPRDEPPPISPRSPRSPMHDAEQEEDGWLSSIRSSTTQAQARDLPATFSSFRRATSTSFQLAPAVTFPSPSASTSTYSPTAPSSTLLRPRSAATRARPDLQSESLTSFWRDEREHARRSDEVLREAEARLGRAERSLRAVQREAGVTEVDEHFIEEERTARILQDVPAVPSSPPSNTDGDASRILDLPSIHHLPSPEHTRPRPVIGVRVGSGWPSSSTSRERAALQLSPTSPSASSPSSDGSSSNGTGSRALHFLSQLRSRRPRLSRNSTGVPPPESPEILLSSAAEEREGWLDSAGFERDRDEERRMARIAERDAWREGLMAMRSRQPRAVAAIDGVTATRSNTWASRFAQQTEDDPTSSSLWGSVAPSSNPRPVATASVPAFNPTSRRMRGPTERANERWRLGQEPLRTAPTSTNPRGSSVVADRPNPTSLFTSAAEALARLPRQDFTLQRNDEDAEVADDIFRGAHELSSSRASIRILRPRVQVPLATRTRLASQQSNPLQQDEPDGWEDEEAAIGRRQEEERGRGWRRPYMLPSGSVGRRGGERAELVGSDEERDTRSRRTFRDQQREPLYFHPAFAFESSTASDLAAARRHREEREDVDAQQQASARLFTTRRLPIVVDSSSPRHDSPPSPPVRERSSIAEALALFRATTAPSPSNDDSTLRRRRATASSATDDAAEPSLPELTANATERHAARTERLQSLRRERNIVRALLGGVGATPGSPEAIDEQPRSPGGTRRRGLSEFFRGMGGVGGRFVAAWDDDFAGFYRRDSAALDPRNYLDDDEFDSSYDALLRLSEQLGDVKPKGVSADRVSALKTFAYSEWPMPVKAAQPIPVGVASTSAVTMDEDLPAFARKGIEKEERCAICLQDYEDDEECMLGHCHHGFHADCFKAWLKGNSCCPVCRRDHAE